MKFEKWAARVLGSALLATWIVALAAIVSLAAMPAKASIERSPGSTAMVTSGGGAVAVAELSTNTDAPIVAAPMGSPRCQLEVTQDSYRDGDTVRASLHLSNPTPEPAQVEMKIWFSAPGEPPLSLADPEEAGRTLELPGMLNRDSGNLRLFAVDATTPRGTYQMNCRLIDPVTGGVLSEDLNAFQVY